MRWPAMRSRATLRAKRFAVPRTVTVSSSTSPGLTSSADTSRESEGPGGSSATEESAPRLQGCSAGSVSVLAVSVSASAAPLAQAHSNSTASPSGS
eukprot:1603950-Rhodomonas_salina.2